jgi:hypothetical protein
LPERISEYLATLEDYSKRLLPVIDWEPTQDGNVQVRNDTADFYRFFDATPHAEFLYACVKKTIEEDLSRETAFLAHYDQFRSRIEELVDMPDRTIDLLFRFLRQNNGRLSNRARTEEFSKMTEAEVGASGESNKSTAKRDSPEFHHMTVHKNVQENQTSAICNERKQTPRIRVTP